MRGADLLARIGSSQQGRLFVWLPVFMIAGALFYFSLRWEPPAWLGAAVFAPLAIAAWFAGYWGRVALLPVAAGALGFTAAQLATLRALPPEGLPRRAVVITGTAAALDILPVGRRVTLTAPSLDGAPPLRRTLRVRLRNNDPTEVQEGDTVRIRALVQSPSPPAYPGAWDLQRDAFFAGMAGYGFALGPIEVLAHRPRDGPRAALQSLRETIATRFEAALPGAPGAVAATLLTGTPSAIPEADREAFRASGLAHLLAVAGLHIGIVMGLIFGATRGLLACFEYPALHWPVKQIAALASLAAGGFYMLLTNMHVPIVRSFLMAALFTIAVLLGRSAVSVRGLALAAAALVLLEPQEVPNVSFQMSFAAVLALIAGYEALRPHLHTLHGDGGGARRLGLHVTALALTSLIAGTASAPFGAYHFGKIQLYFVLANMIAVPLTAMWVMPAGLIALALLPLHLEQLALIPMGWGIQAILFVARRTAALPASILPVPHMPAWGLAVLALGMAVLALWRGPWRLAGTGLIAAGLASVALVHPPDILVSADARMVGVRAPSGFYLYRQSGASAFTRDSWTAYWADGPPMTLPDTAPWISCSGDGCRIQSAVLLLRRGDQATTCGAIRVVIALGPLIHDCPSSVPVVTRFWLRTKGATAIWLDPLFVLTDQGERGLRPWTEPPPAPSEHLTLPLAQAGA